MPEQAGELNVLDLLNELGAGRGPSVTFAVHDGSRVEWTTNVPVEAHAYDLRVDLEVPAQLFAQQTPWHQLQSYARLDEPGVGEGNRGDETAVRIRRSTVAATLKLARASQGFERHLSIALESDDALPAPDALLLWVEFARTTVVEERTKLSAPEAGGEVARERALADDYLGTELIATLTGAARALKQAAAGAGESRQVLFERAEAEIARTLEAEAAHRRDAGQLTFLADDPGALELYQEHASLLKKHFQQVLFLEPEVMEVGKRAQNYVAGFVALLASTWALAWQLALFGHRGQPTLGSGIVFIALVSGMVYAFKDRIKELGRTWVTGRLHRYLGQRVARYRVPVEIDAVQPVLLTASESFGIETAAQPDPLGSGRRSSRVSVIRFSQKARIARRGALTAGAARIRQVFRYDLSPLFPRMHDLAKPVAVPDHSSGKVRFLDAPRTYRLNLRATLRIDDESAEQQAILVMNKQGLQRIEMPRSRGSTPPGHQLTGQDADCSRG